MSRKLLLADDSITIQRVIELTFADEDIRVTSVGDGDAAIRLLDTDPHDIVLADIGMPGSDGYAVARHVRDTPALKGMPVLLLTGAFDPVDEGRVTELGCAGVLVKPFEPQMLIARVRELLDAAPARSAPAAGSADAPQSSAQAPAAEAPGPAVAELKTGPPGDSAPQPATSASRDHPTDPASGTAASPTGQQTSPGRDGVEPLSPADALIAAPSSPAADERASSVDEYFARLDAAFATLDVPLDMPRSTQPGSRPARSGHAAEAAASAAPAAADTAAVPPPSTLADAFGLLLGVEQGEPIPIFADAWQPAIADDLIDAVARRVTEKMSDQVVRDLAPDIVSRIAERMVREEIERVKGRGSEAGH